MTDDVLDRLKTELSQLKTDFNRRADELERRIQFYEDRQALPAALQVVDTPKISATSAGLPDQKRTETAARETFGTHVRTGVPEPETDKPSAARTPEPTQQAEHLKTIFKAFTENILPVFSPVTVLFFKLITVFRHYQSQGKAPVFFMTIAGILTLVMGFGYLLQYSFSQFLGPIGKVAIGFGTAAAVTLCGIIVAKKRSDMADYAASLIGLGMILAYLCAYFTGPYYRLLPDSGTFFLLAGLTALSYILAVAYETRVVAVVSLFGGVFAPLLTVGAVGTPIIYLSYVLILAAAMLHLSHRIAWPLLGHLCMVISFLVIEAVIFSAPARMSGSPQAALILHLFFYLFICYCLLTIVKLSTLNRVTIILYSSTIFFYLLTLKQVIPSSLILGGVYLANAVLFAGMVPLLPLILKKAVSIEACKKPVQLVCLMSCGLLAGFGILAVTDPELLGMVWGAEALVLLALGIRFNMVQVRIESVAILTISFVISAYYALLWIFDSLVPAPQIFELELGYGWVNLMVTWILPALYISIMERSKAALTKFETTGLYICNEILSVSMSLAFLMTVGILKNYFIWLLGILPLFFLVYRAKTKQLKFTEYFALLHVLLLAVPMLTSARIVESLYFNEQLPIGKIARVEAFLCLYAIAEFYRRFHNSSRLSAPAQVLRPLFFCIIPISFLPGIWHQFSDFFPLSVWLSAVVCLALCWKLKYQSLFLELKLITIGAALVSVGACALVKFAGWQGHGFSALIMGLVFFAGLLFGLRGMHTDPKGSDSFLKFREHIFLLFTLAFYYLGIFLFILTYAATGAAALAFTLMTGLFFIFFFKRPQLYPLKSNGMILYAVVGLSVVSMILIHLLISLDGFDLSPGINAMLFRIGIFNFILLGIYGTLVHLPASHFKETRQKIGWPLIQLWIFHFTVCMAYIGALAQWFLTAFGPALSVALVLHATAVLFLTLKPKYQKLISLAVVLFSMAAVKIIFFDMVDFSLIQKMIAFIAIGALLLGAAFQYQRVRTKSIATE